MKKYFTVGFLFMLALLGIMAEAESFALTFALKLLGVALFGIVAILWNLWRMGDRLDVDDE